MDDYATLDLGKETIFVLIKVASPVLLTALAVGLVVSFFQALTQIQETTLSFVPKILAVFVALILFMPFMISNLKMFAEHIGSLIANIS